MSKTFRPSSREETLLSKIESSRDFARRRALNGIQDCIEPLSNAIATKLIENGLVETANKNGLQERISQSLDKLSRADDFDIDYQTSPFRGLAPHPHVVALYLTAFVIEKLIDDKDVVDVFGSDEDIYVTIEEQIRKYLP
ncbi:conserved hypothetical protein [Candidatus Desulfarcum epimagneticum]|uniref:Uncharacterized protein n=1 Tax=uncultured Desulfobacteraceae bacterium TaxID=218296 RepID=A0A484HG05_9BACT|nr:conserved hypothetical protein [uncultured Desulfobacteraceae bacterium]